jgi:hypothetical protein
MPSTINGSSNFNTASSVLQQVYVDRSDVVTGTTLLPIDNTIPQITEGDQIFTLSITPKLASSVLLLELSMYATSGSNRFIYGAAVFRDGAANAICAGINRFAADNGVSPMGIIFRTTSNSTAATTFTVRAGTNLANANFFLNGNGTSGFFGGTLYSSFTITEIAA